MALLGDSNANTTAQGGMRPPKLREKLSSLVRRKGSTKSRSQLNATTTTTTTTTTSTTTTARTSLARRSEDLYSVRTSNGAPLLDVNLERTRSYRLAEGWLEDESRKSPSSPGKRRNGQVGGGGDRERKLEKGADDIRQQQSKTPIAAMFSKSTDQLASTLETISFRKLMNPPASVSTTMLPAATAADGSTFGVKTTKHGPQESTTTKQARVPEPEPQPIRISLHHSIVEEPAVVTTPKVSQVPQSRGRTMQASWGIRPVVNDAFDEAPQRHSIRQVGLLRSVGDNTTGLRVSGGGNGNSNGGGSAVGDSAKRFSAPSISSPVPVPVPEPTSNKTAVFPTTMSRSSSLNTSAAAAAAAAAPAPPRSFLNPDNQRQQSWPAPRTSQDGGMRPPPQRTLSSRPPSVALTSSRLSWIRDLENKSSSSSSSSSSVPELQKLKKNPGSVGVAGKLAMFEQIQRQTAPLPPAFISRSNSRASSRSRMSSAAFTDPITTTQHADGNGGGRPLSYVSTARTSMDSTRESLLSSISNRNSGVMAYYDQGFREKMEGVAGGWAKKLEKLAGGGSSKKEEETADQSCVQADSPTEATTPSVKAEEEWKAPVHLPFLADITGGNVKDDGKLAEEKKAETVERPSEDLEEATVPEESKTEPEVAVLRAAAEEGPKEPEEKVLENLPLVADLPTARNEEEAAEMSDAAEVVEEQPVKEDGAIGDEQEESTPVASSLPLPVEGQAVSDEGEKKHLPLPLPADVQVATDGEEPTVGSGVVEEKEKEKETLPLPAQVDVQVVTNDEEPAEQSNVVEQEGGKTMPLPLPLPAATPNVQEKAVSGVEEGACA